MSANDERRERIEKLVADQLREVLAGRPSDEAALIEQHQDLLPEIEVELRKVRLFGGASRWIDRDSTPGSVEKTEVSCSTDTLPTSEWSTKADGGLRIRCAACYTMLKIPPEFCLHAITCSSCGAGFNLVGDEFQDDPLGESRHIAQFELLERLGAGGFGTVWKALDTQLDRFVAIKVPRRGQLNAAEAELFLREARAAAQLHYAGIVRIYEIGRERDVVYIVSELIEGMSLAEWLKGRRMSAREAAELCSKLAEALIHAHEHGVIHRDLKPGNILLDADQQPYITDFGLARRETGEITMTVDGQLVGTPAYMSPEQARGDSHTSDVRSDVYSLGVTLFELLTGELPFRGITATLLHQVIHDDPPNPRTLNKIIPRDLETITLKCLAKSPARRYATAQELADDLGRFLRHEPIHARPASRAERAWRWGKRSPARASLLLVAIAFSLIAPIVALRERSLRSAIETTANDLSRQVYLADIQKASQALEMGEMERVQSILQQYKPRAGLVDYRGFEWYLLQRESTRNVVAPAWQHSGYTTSVAFSPDGAKLLWGGEHGRIELCDVAKRKTLLQLIDADGRAGIGPCAFVDDGSNFVTLPWDDGRQGFSGQVLQLRDTRTGDLISELDIAQPFAKYCCIIPRSGRVVAATSAGELVFCSWNGATPTKRFAVPYRPISVAASADGTLLAVGAFDGRIFVYRLPDFDIVCESRHQGKVTCPCIPPQRRLSSIWRLSGGEAWTIYSWDIPSGRLRDVLVQHTNELVSVKFSPDGSSLASASLDHSIVLWDLKESSPIAVTRLTSPGSVLGLAFSPQGDTLASCGRDGGIRLWNVARFLNNDFLTAPHAVWTLAASADGRKIVAGLQDWSLAHYDLQTGKRTLRSGHVPEEVHVVFGDHDQRIFSGGSDHKVRVWSPEEFEEMAPPLECAHGIRSLASSADGRFVVAGLSDGSVITWDAHSLRQLSSVQAHEGISWDVAMSADGALIASGGRDRVVRIWRTEDASLYREFPALPDSVTSVIFSPDRTFVLAGNRDGAIRMWNVDSGRLIRELRGHGQPVWGLAFSPDAATFASGGDDGTVRLWDLETGDLRVTLKGHGHFVNHITFAPDGRSIISGSSDRTIRFWRASDEWPAKQAATP